MEQEKIKKILRTQRSNIEKMKEVSHKTDYETGMSVCSAGTPDSRHVRNVVVGDETEIIQGDCTPGTDTEVAIHTHPKPAPPSETDLRRVKENDATRCVMPIKNNGSAKLVCMSGDNFDPAEASRNHTQKQDYNMEDLNRMKKAGVKVQEFTL